MRWLAVALLVVVGCGDHTGDAADLSIVGADDLGMAADLQSARDLALAHGDGGLFLPRGKVDILFMVDNSPSMSAKQNLLHQSFPAFATALKDAAALHPASYHIGVVTDDLGAGPYTLNQGQCSPGGFGGKLQSAASPGAMGVPAACSTLALGGGVRYIDYDQIHGSDNLGGLDVSTAFTCISSVGEAGCGFEQPLESTYKALHDPIAENVGFLRADALLVVVYVTDEDDCSAPANTDLFDPSQNGINTYGVMHSFRCTQFGIACGNPATQVQPIDSNGPLAGCRPLTMAEGGKLIDVQKYVDYFGKPASLGGVKIDPSDVILASIAAPKEPFATTVTMPCADQVNTASCPILGHSCTQTGNAQIFGDPAVRLGAVVGAAATSQQSSACDSDYSPSLSAIAQKIIARLP
jgi:hypothetical protein